MTHTGRPAGGNARLAWDYFREKCPGREIKALYYSPCCAGARAWVCEFAVTDTDMMHCDTYDDWWVKTVLVSSLRRWNSERTDCEGLL